ncbi:hypothetical protein NMG60_11013278 [Bertholletia excelsa]
MTHRCTSFSRVLTCHLPLPTDGYHRSAKRDHHSSLNCLATIYLTCSPRPPAKEKLKRKLKHIRLGGNAKSHAF